MAEHMALKKESIPCGCIMYVCGRVSDELDMPCYIHDNGLIHSLIGT